MRIVTAILCCLICGRALALGPHEVLVLANENSVDSIEIARTFAAARHVPEQNVIRLGLPPSVTNAAAQISPEDFTRFIWTPANRLMKERGIDDHILAWVYSIDFPVIVTSEPPVSLQGLTFVRNVLPEGKKISEGTVVSAVFGGIGPDSYVPRSFDSYREMLKDEMPLPSMLLGYTGQRGNTKATVLKCIERGVLSDYSAPSGTVYLVTGADVRAKCREWQFKQVRNELSLLGVKCVVGPALPAKEPGIMGLMVGLATVEPGAGNVYLPGSMAEHLTSCGAIFSAPEQTKLSMWIDAGATASSGAVVEPMSIWAKFPTARFHFFYASGCTMMESFYQSVKCPLQLLIVGEPLAQPWGATGDVKVSGLGAAPVSGKVRLEASATGKGNAYFGRFAYFVDGRTAGTGKSFELDTSLLAPGEHLLRCVAYRTGSVRSQIFTEVKFTVAGRGGAREAR